jgi:hypothetical protein
VQQSAVSRPGVDFVGGVSCVRLVATVLIVVSLLYARAMETFSFAITFVTSQQCGAPFNISFCGDQTSLLPQTLTVTVKFQLKSNLGQHCHRRDYRLSQSGTKPQSFSAN